MRVLVTGATGFIGRWILPALVARDCEVVALTCRSSEAYCHGTKLTSGRVRWIVGDLLDHSTIASTVADANADTLVHTAWDTTPGTYWTSSKNLDWISASLKLFQAFQESGGRRIVVAGTSAEYEWGGNEDLVEGKSEQPNTLYGTAKDSLRRMVEQWASIHNLSWAWGRVFCPFGENERPERLIPKLIARLRTDEPMPFDSGSLIRDFISVQDLGDAFAALATSNVQGPINLASGQDTSIRDIVTVLAQHMGQIQNVQFGTLPDPHGQPQRIVADITRQTTELGWHPSATLKQRLIENCDWWMNEQINVKD
ncbi:NAD(P)-dependent oxidoreductase [Novipirellula caenicola]|uniref:dTDP-6-deoxy-L-talose 4-dehydrogenase (NAD(+)) n=1 Tax=Novipirellula caenicola TaxID=1536901 RepID=A0ABP9VZ60_9BACT